jgi:HSP20 family molecular chaperone IbpA
MAEQKNTELRKQSQAQELSPVPGVAPVVDVYENDDEYLVVADLPGVPTDAVEARFDRGELTLEARREPPANPGSALANEFGGARFVRTFRVPEKIDGDAIEAKLEHGVLHLRLPKSPEIRPRKIAIRAG